jgi:hypothetical protein
VSTVNRCRLHTDDEQYKYNIIYKRSVYLSFATKKFKSSFVYFFSCLWPISTFEERQMEIQEFTVLNVTKVMEEFQILSQ